MLKVITEFILKSKISSEAKTRQKKFLSWDSIEKIAIVIEKNDAINKSALDKFVEDTKKYTEVFYIETRSKQGSYSDWHCFSRKEKSILNLPNKQVESELKSKKFDVVINTCSETNLFAFGVCSSLNASLKCGENNRFNIADLIIKKEEASNLINYLSDTVRYLKMIRS